MSQTKIKLLKTTFKKSKLKALKGLDGDLTMSPSLLNIWGVMKQQIGNMSKNIMLFAQVIRKQISTTTPAISLLMKVL